MNANEFFLNRAGTAKPEFRRNDASGALGGPIRQGRTFFFVAGQQTRFKSGYASNATAATGLPVGLTTCGRPRPSPASPTTICATAPPTTRPFAANFLRALRAFPADQQAGLIAHVLHQRQHADVPRADAGRHPSGRDQHPEHEARRPLPDPVDHRRHAGAARQRHLRPRAAAAAGHPDRVERLVRLRHRCSIASPPATTRGSTFVRSTQRVEEAFGWADASPSPTDGNTPALLGGVTNTHTFGSRLLQEVSVGYFDLENTRISTQPRHLQLDARHPQPARGVDRRPGRADADHRHQHAAQLRRHRQRLGLLRSPARAARGARWSLVAGQHTLQSGVEYRRVRLDSEYMSRTNGDLDYDNWVFFFTGHGASGGGSDLDQGDTRRDFRTQDAGVFVQDDWKIGRGLTVNAGLRYDVFGMLTENATAASATTTCPRPRRRSASTPGFNVPAQRAVLPARLRPAAASGSTWCPARRSTSSQIHVAPNDSTLRGDKNNVAPRVGLAWQPTFAPEVRRPRRLGPLLRTPLGRLQGRPAARRAVLHLPERAGAARHGQSVSAAERQPVPDPARRPHRARRQRRAALGQGATGSSVPGDVAVQPRRTTPSSIRSSRRRRCSSGRRTCSRRPAATCWLDLRYVGSRGQDLLGKINLAVPIDPRVTPVNGFTDIYDAQRRADQPGLLRAGGVPRPQPQRRLPAADQRRPLDLSRVPDRTCAAASARAPSFRPATPRQVARHAVVRSIARRTRSDAAREQLRPGRLRPPASA